MSSLEEMKAIQSLNDLPTDDSVSLSSSSTDSSSSSEEQGDESQRKSSKEVKYDEASSSSSSDDSSDDSSDESSSSDEDEHNVEERMHAAIQQQHDYDSSSSDDYSSSDDEDLQNVSLEERVQRKQEAGRKRSSDTRERKKQALQVASERLHQQHKPQSTKTKKSKHRPTEASSKRFDFFRRGAPTLDSSGVGVEITSHRYKPRDPRTSKSTGALDSHYAFLQELRKNEIATLKKRIAVQKLSGKKGQRARRKMGLARGSLQHDQEELTRLLQEKAGYERAQVDLAAQQAVKRKMKQQVASGKGVYYLKKREMKRLQQEAKFEELRKRGGDKAVDKALAKRRKKNKSKDTGYFIPKDI